MRATFMRVLALLMCLHAVAHAAETDSRAIDLNDEQQSDDAPSTTYRLPETVVTGRQDSMIGIAAAASQGTVGEEQLKYRALARPGELLETVPGLILTQHSGGGKANQ